MIKGTINNMKLYIDGDALPNLLKPILLKPIIKRDIETIVISNKKISLGESKPLPNITYIIVLQGADKADDKIVEMIQKDDLVITADIPLANRVPQKDAYALDHRGTIYTDDNIKEYLAIRNLMETIRDTGEITKGPKPFTAKDSSNFANGLNEILQKIKW